MTELASHLRDCSAVLGTLSHVMNANLGTPAGHDSRLVHAEALARKCAYHVASFVHLAQGPDLQVGRRSDLDVGSAGVLTRAAVEAVLVFHYIYILPTTPEEAQLRYDAWLLHDLQERQGVPARSAEAKKQLETDAAEIHRLKQSLRSNVALQLRTAKGQSNLLNGRKWRAESWTTIAENMGLGELSAVKIYRFLCSYAHAGSLALIQLRQARERQAQERLLVGFAGHILVMMARLIRGYAALFPASKAALDAKPAEAQQIELWCGVGEQV